MNMYSYQECYQPIVMFGLILTVLATELERRAQAWMAGEVGGKPVWQALSR